MSLNPIEWLKIAYEAVGVRYPIGSLVAVMIIGALVFGLLWLVGGKQYEKDLARKPETTLATPATSHPVAIQSPVTGSAVTHGSNSPANTGSGNTISYGEPVLKARTASKYSHEIFLEGPDKMTLRVFSARDGVYGWTLRKGGLTDAAACSLQITEARSRDLQESAFRSPIGFNRQLGKIKTLKAGDLTQSFVFLRTTEHHLEFGDTVGQGILRWPSGDSSAEERWLLDFKINGLSSEWPIRLCIRWVRGANTVELMEYSDDILATQF